MNISVGTASWTDKTLIGLGPVLPGRLQDAGGPPALLRAAVPDGRGGRELLHDSLAPDSADVGRANPTAVHLQREGVSPLHRAPDRPKCLEKDSPEAGEPSQTLAYAN
jgi:hypothetical protein